MLDAGVPFFGICFGNQLLGRALGFDTYKLKFGHRGINQPVQDRETGQVAITAHNHGFAVDVPLEGEHTAPHDGGRYGRVVVSHVGLNDDVVEGLRCLDLPAYSVQYHPEAAGGPHDASPLFDRLVELAVAHRAGSADKESDAPPYRYLLRPGHRLRAIVIDQPPSSTTPAPGLRPARRACASSS